MRLLNSNSDRSCLNVEPESRLFTKRSSFAVARIFILILIVVRFKFAILFFPLQQVVTIYAYLQTLLKELLNIPFIVRIIPRLKVIDGDFFSLRELSFLN
jgi:hypothetical protein